MDYQEEDPSAHAILEQHISNVVPITGKAIRNALMEHEVLTHAYKRTVEEYERLRQLFDQLTEERTKELLKRDGTDAVVGAINALTEVVRQAVMPPMMQITLDEERSQELTEQVERSQMSNRKIIVIEPASSYPNSGGDLRAEAPSDPAPPEEGQNGSPR